MLYYLIVAQLTHYYIITAARTALDDFIVGNAEGSTASARKYFIIKRILFLFKKKFVTTGNKRRYLGKDKYLERISLALIFMRAVL